jgi:hypothetical protein
MTAKGTKLCAVTNKKADGSRRHALTKPKREREANRDCQSYAEQAEPDLRHSSLL